MKFMDMNLGINIIKEGKSVIAYSPALDLSSSGKTEKVAKKRFGEIVRIFFSDLIKRGVFEEVMTELGWTKNVTSARLGWQPPRIDQRCISVNVPVPA